MQGVSIVLFIKSRGWIHPTQLGKVFYQDVFGLQGNKYDYLNKNEIKTIRWKELKLSEPYYFFVEKDFSLQASYEKFLSVKDIFMKYNAGVATGKDKILVDFNQQNLARKLSTRDKEVFYLSMENYGVEKELISKWYKELEGKNVEEQIKPYTYRLFDNRFVVYNKRILQRARESTMDHMLKGNLGLILTKQLAKLPFRHSFVSNKIGDRCLISLRTKELGYFFPLYLYPTDKEHLLSSQESSKKRPNINPEILKSLSETYKQKISPEQIFYYIYAVLYSNIYRKKYAEFLKIDFPKIPFTKDYNLFIKVGKLGKRLVDLHLLKSDELNSSVAKFQGTGDNKVEKPKYSETENKVYINNNQYFEGLKKELWNYQIGGYYVLDKWLKSRKGRTLSLADITHYCNIITALKKTIEIQKEIDKLYLEVAKSVKPCA